MMLSPCRQRRIPRQKSRSLKEKEALQLSVDESYFWLQETGPPSDSTWMRLTKVRTLQKQIGQRFKAKGEMPLSCWRKRKSWLLKRRALTEAEQRRTLSWGFKVNQSGQHCSRRCCWLYGWGEQRVGLELRNQEFEKLVKLLLPQVLQPSFSTTEVLLKLDGYDPEREVSRLLVTVVISWKKMGCFLEPGFDQLRFVPSCTRRDTFHYKLQWWWTKDVMAKTPIIPIWRKELYKGYGWRWRKYLIATSEQPISAYHSLANGLRAQPNNCLLDTLVTLRVSEEKLVLMVRMHGVFSECTLSRRLSNSSWPSQKSLGKSLTEWLPTLRSLPEPRLALQSCRYCFW